MCLTQAAAVVFLLLWTSANGQNPEVSCVFMESCVLPCSFQNGTDPVIHWVKEPDNIRVHSFYYGQNQLSLQHQDYRNRTSLFVEELSRGNGSLLLTKVKHQDGGRYRCYTSIPNRENSEESYINLKVYDPEVSCVFMKSCVLPCSFTSGADPVIHWTKEPDDVPVHIYYHGQNQFKYQHENYTDRTSLFEEEISRGNASLLLSQVKVQDEGRYECYINTVNRDSEESYINLRVEGADHSVITAVVVTVLLLLAGGGFLFYRHKKKKRSQA